VLAMTNIEKDDSWVRLSGDELALSTCLGRSRRGGPVNLLGRHKWRRSSSERAGFEGERATKAPGWSTADQRRDARAPLRIARLLGIISCLAAGVLEADDVAPILSNIGTGIDHTNIAVIINTADPLSVSTGEYYVRARQVPASNVIRVRFASHASELPVDEFQRLRARVEGSAPPLVQAYVLTWTAPYRVGCMSITSAFAFGYDRAYCASACAPTKASAYFDSASRSPSLELGIRPAMMLAGHSLPEVKALIDRGVRSDGTNPRASAYLLITSDHPRNTRALLYPLVRSPVPDLIDIKILRQDALTERKDVMFYFTGLSSVAGLGTLEFLPGAVADHLTSVGGMLTDSTQMSALSWLNAGATGSYGTVVEPCNFPQKFPHPAIVIRRYVLGETLIEAYWKSVAWPGQGVFVGEPLATPYRAAR